MTERSKNSTRTEILKKEPARRKAKYRAEAFIEIICFLFSGKLCEYGTILAYGNISFDLLRVY